MKKIKIKVLCLLLMTSLVLVFCWSFSNGQVRTVSVEDFIFSSIVDTIKSEVNEEPLVAFNEIVTHNWRVKPASQTNNIQSVQSPFYHKGVVFVPNIIDCAFDAATGEKILFGSHEAKTRFQKFGQDTLISFTGLQGFRTLIVNVLTGKKCAEMEKQSGGKAPFFLENKTWLYVKWVGDSSLLIARDIESGRDLWSMPFQKFSILKTVVVNEHLFSADNAFLYAINLKSGYVFWKMPLSVNYLSEGLNELFVSSSSGLFNINISSISAPVVQWRLSCAKVLGLSFEDDFLYVQSHNSLLLFDCKAKKIMWKGHFFFNFYPFDQLSLTEDYIITTNSEDTKYNLIFKKTTGQLMAWNINADKGFRFAKKGVENTSFAIDAGELLHSIQLIPR